MKAYKLKKISLENIGGNMANQSTPTIWEKYFKNKSGAKKFCVKDHGKKIKWSPNGKYTSAEDYGSYSYDIIEIEIDESE